ncbi:hypothetical protein ACIBQ1_52525 [Nonomuraea sp. NPDC050153]
MNQFLGVILIILGIVAAVSLGNPSGLAIGLVLWVAGFAVYVKDIDGPSL